MFPKEVQIGEGIESQKRNQASGRTRKTERKKRGAKESSDWKHGESMKGVVDSCACCHYCGVGEIVSVRHIGVLVFLQEKSDRQESENHELRDTEKSW